MNQGLLELLQREDNISTYAISQLMESYEYLEGSTLPLYNKLQEMQLEKEISFEEEIERLVDIDFATYDHRHREPFTEAYEGKTKELLKIEKLIGEVMKICRESNMGVNPNKLPQTKLISSLIKKMFGLREVYFLWQATMVDEIFNPYTVHIINDVGHKVDLTSDKPFYNKKGKGVLYVKLHTSLFMFHSLTPAHVTAILLSTIGTRFATVPWDVLNTILDILVAYGGNTLASLLYRTKFMKKISYKFSDLFEQFKTLPPIYFLLRILRKLYDTVNKTIEAIVAPVASIITTVGGIAPFFLLSPIWAVVSAMTSSDILYADQFTAHFGYGPELVEAIQILKYENTKFGYVTDKNDHMLNYLIDMTNAATELLGNVGGLNTTETRAAYMLKRMEEDIKQMDLPESGKKPMQEELKRLRTAYDYYVLDMKHDDYTPFTIIVRKTMEQLNHGMNLGTVIFHKVAGKSLSM